MALLSHIETFAMNTFTGDRDILIPFEPLLVIYYGNEMDGNGVQGNDMMFIGAATNSNQFTMSQTSEDGQGSSDSGFQMGDTRCFEGHVAGSGTRLYRGTFQTTLSGPTGFRHRIEGSPAPAIPYQVTAVCLGDDGGAETLTDVFIGQYTILAGTGNQDVISVGFPPDALMAFANSSATTPTSGGSSMLPCVGYAVNGGEQYTMAHRSRNGQGTSATGRFQRTDRFLAGVTDTGNIDYELMYQTSLFNGFRFSAPVDGTGRVFNFIALRGGSYHIGTVDTETSTGTFSLTGAGFKPSGGIFNSILTNTEDSVVGSSKWSIGAASDNAQWAMGGTDRNGQGTTVADQFQRTGEVFLDYENFDQIKSASAKVDSFNSDGATMNQTVASASTPPLHYFLWGPGEAISGITKQVTTAYRATR